MTTQELASQQQKLNELKELAASGVKLPMSPEAIILIEAEGDLVDLESGEIVKGGARMTVVLTETGQQVVRHAPI